MKRLFLLLVLIISSFGLFGQNPHYLIDPEPLLVPTVSQLEMEDVETGILYDAGYTPVDFRNFDGSYNCAYSSDISVFYSILKGVKSCVVSNSVLVPVADTVMSHMSNYLAANHRVPVGIAVYDYNQIAPNAITSGSLGFQVVDNEIMLENVELPDGSYANPYVDSTLVAFSPYVNVVPRSVTYDFSSLFHYTNRTINAIYFDAGKNTGFQQITTNGTYSVTYTTPSVKTIKVKVVLDGNEQLYAKSTVRVIDESSFTGGNNNTDPFSWDVQTFTSEIESDGVYPIATISIRYANGSSFSKQPLIVAEGFDPISDPLGLFLDDNVKRGHGVNNIQTFYKKVRDYSGIGDYDIIYVDWFNSTCSIQSNADILKQVIIWVNNNKPAGLSNILIGQSMGGLIARYALRQMEQDWQYHEVSTFVSDDSPHLGANIPLGFMYLAQWCFDTIGFAGIGSVLGTFETLVMLLEPVLNNTNYALLYRDELMRIRNGTSVKQMIKYYVNPLFSIDTYQYDSFQQVLRSIGFPRGGTGQGILNLCLSNGGINNYVQDNLPLLRIGNSSTSHSLVAPILYFWSAILTGHLSSLLGPPVYSVHEEFKVNPHTHSGDSLFCYKRTYIKDYSWGNQYSLEYPEIAITAPSSVQPMDGVYGSYYDISWLAPGPDITDVLEVLGVEVDSQVQFLFVPSVSSLCYKNGIDLVVPASFETDFNSASPSMDDIPFDGYRFHNSKASYHAEIDNYDLAFVLGLDGIQLLDSTITATGSKQYYLNKPGFSVTWSSSDTTVATIDSNTGVVTPVNYGTCILSANIDYGGGHLRLKRTLNLPPPSSIQFQTYTLSYRDFSLENDYLNDSYRITASASGVYPDDILPYIKYCWGRKLSGQSTITWTESNNLTRFVTIPVIDDHVVYFRVKYLNYTYSPTYSILCHPRPKIVPIDPFGNLYTEDMGEVIAQVKGGAIGEVCNFTCLGLQVSFDHEPTLAELVNRLLDYDIFVTEVKKAKPWGEEDTVIIPYEYGAGDPDSMLHDVIVLQYNPSFSSL